MLKQDQQPTWVRVRAAEVLLAVDAESLKPFADFLAGALDDEDLGVRIRAARTLAQIDPARADKAVDILVAAQAPPSQAAGPGQPQDANHWRMVELAMSQLSRLGAAALPSVRRLLESEDVARRQQAVNLLGGLGPAAKATLIEALDDTDSNVRMMAAGWLGHLGAEANDAAPALMAALGKVEPQWRASFAQALVQVDPDRGLAVLHEWLSDAEPQVRRNALQNLSWLAPKAPETKTAVLAALKDEVRDVRLAAVFAMHGTGPLVEAVPALIEFLHDADPFAFSQSAQMLARLGPAAKEAVPALVEALAAREKRREVIEALLKIDPAQASQAVPALVAELDDEKLSVRVSAALNLLRIDSSGGLRVNDLQTARTMPILIEALKGPIGDMGPPGDAGPPGQGDDRPPDPTVVAIALGDVGPAAKEAGAAVSEIMQHPNLWPFSRFAVAEALAKIDPDRKPEAVAVLREMVFESANPFLRVDSAGALVRLEPTAWPETVAVVLATIENRHAEGMGMDAKLAGRAIAALGAIVAVVQRGESLWALEKLTHDADPAVSSAAKAEMTKLAASKDAATAPAASNAAPTIPALPATPRQEPVEVPPPPLPEMEPPGTRQALAAVAGKKLQLVLVVAVCECVPETRMTTVRVDGRDEARTEAYYATHTVLKFETRSTGLDQIKAYGLDRKRIAARKLAELLKTPRPVLVCDPNTKFDSVYLQIVKPDTLVLILPPPNDFVGAPTPIANDGPPVEPPSPSPSPPPAPLPVAADEPTVEPPASSSPAPATEKSLPDPFVPPGGPQPAAQLASLTDDGKLRLRRSVSSTIETTGYRTIVEGNAERMEPATIKRLVRREISEDLDFSAVRAYTTDGQTIASDELRQRLAKETAVLTSKDGLKVDPGHLKIIKQNVVVLVLPAAQPPAFVRPTVEEN